MANRVSLRPAVLFGALATLARTFRPKAPRPPAVAARVLDRGPVKKHRVKTGGGHPRWVRQLHNDALHNRNWLKLALNAR